MDSIIILSHDDVRDQLRIEFAELDDKLFYFVFSFAWIQSHKNGASPTVQNVRENFVDLKKVVLSSIRYFGE